MSDGVLNDLEEKTLRASAGQIVELPYDRAQQAASAALRDAGLIEIIYEDDQPTAVATLRGRLLLARIGETRDDQ